MSIEGISVNGQVKKYLYDALDNKDSIESRVTTLEEGGLNLKDEVITAGIENWLDDHPEATTTVQDGAITESKINSTFLPSIKNAYVTPEMFGAVGDGVTDDSDAVQSAINSGAPVLFSNEKVYKIATDINVIYGSVLFSFGENKYSENIKNIILSNAKFNILERKVTIKNLSIFSENAETAFVFTNANITDLSFQNLFLHGFTRCFVATESNSYMWRIEFTRLHTIECETIIDYETSYSGFDLNFSNCYFDGIVKFKGVHATFNNCNFGLNVYRALDFTQCYVTFIGCNFENDVQVTEMSFNIDQTQCVFITCLLYEFQASGVHFFEQRNGSSVLFISCEVKSKTGSAGTWWKITGEGYKTYGNVVAWNTKDTILPSYTYSGYSNSGLTMGAIPYFDSVSDITTSKLLKNQLFYIKNTGLCFFNGTSIEKYDGTTV